jgi:hypothetical protein
VGGSGTQRRKSIAAVIGMNLNAPVVGNKDSLFGLRSALLRLVVPHIGVLIASL